MTDLPMRVAARAMMSALAVPALAMAATLPAQAQTTPPAPQAQQRVIEGTLLSVSADAEVNMAPDMATISLGVTTDGTTAQAALGENSRRMTALMAELRRAGVEARDVQTSNIGVNPQYVYNQNEPPRITGYQASNQVSVRVRDLGRLGPIVDACVSAGGNQVGGVSFGLSDPTSARNDARTRAMREARARADLYAAAAGLRVHRIISITEGGGMAVPPPIPMMAMARMDAAPPPPPPPPVAAGEITTTATVAVMFELR